MHLFSEFYHWATLMTAKDRNLLTDPAKLAAWAEQNALAKPPNAVEVPNNDNRHPSPRPRADLTAVPTTKRASTGGSRAGATTGKDKRAKRRAKAPEKTPLTHHAQGQAIQNENATTARKAPFGHNRAWLLGAAVALVNMLFLVLAALWLTGTDLKGSFAPIHPTTLKSSNELRAAVEEGNKRLASALLELGTIKAQLTKLENSLQTTNQPKDRPASPVDKKEPPAKPTASTVGTVQRPAAEQEPTPAVSQTISWQVNLGDYASRLEARETQRTLQKLGFQALISSLEVNGAIAYLVNISGFSSREDAESVANEIMVDTQLNGLWVAKTQ
ncbi:MAG: SPOR domain-containing protein [Halioglobus sp.]